MYIRGAGGSRKTTPEALFSKRRCGENPALSNNQIGEAQYIKYAPVGAQERVVKVQHNSKILSVHLPFD